MTAAAAPGRPMSAERETALLDSAISVLARVGYDRFTIGAVCELAGASTKTAYRRWRNKDEMLAAVLRRAVDRELETDFDVTHGGSLRADFIAGFTEQADSYRASPGLVLGLVTASHAEGELGQLARDQIERHEERYCSAILDAAVARGEVGANVDTQFVADLARGFFLHEILVHDSAPSAASIARFVDEVLIPVCTR